MTLLLSLMVMSMSSFTYQTEYSYQKSAFGTTSSYIRYSNSQQAQHARTYQYNKIGYTTNVCRHNYSYGYVTTSKYSTTTPYSPSSSNGRPGPRRIRVYDGDGNEQDTPGRTDGIDWLYEYDESTDTWWCSQDGGLTWKKWDSLWGWGLLGFDWREGRGDPTESATHFHHDPNDPWLTPIGDNYIWFMVCIVSIYSLVKSKRNKLKHSAY